MILMPKIYNDSLHVVIAMVAEEVTSYGDD